VYAESMWVQSGAQVKLVLNMTRIIKYFAGAFVLHIVDNLLYVEAHRSRCFASSSSHTLLSAVGDWAFSVAVSGLRNTPRTMSRQRGHGLLSGTSRYLSLQSFFPYSGRSVTSVISDIVLFTCQLSYRISFTRNTSYTVVASALPRVLLILDTF